MTETRTHGARVLIVTGSSSGFGRLTAQTLARQGYTVHATMRAVEDKNAAAAAALHEWAAREDLALYALELDVADDASVERAVGQILATAGRIDVVVHNAANAAVGYVGPLEGFTLEQVRAQFETNVVGILRMNRGVLPPMRGPARLRQCGGQAPRHAVARPVRGEQVGVGGPCGGVAA
jgi:NAD(P)-dependent dehydrogenase (short-subunit alcohol dehydrogenase family)